MPEIVIAGFLQTATGGIFWCNSGWPQILPACSDVSIHGQHYSFKREHIVTFGGEAVVAALTTLRTDWVRGA